MSVFEITVQAALGFVSQSANDFIIYAASKKISLSADSDQMALPSGHPQAFREKGLTQTLCFVLICADFFMIFFLSNTVILAFLYIYTILYS
ncbi:hypothetical protein [Huintestinicola butyrica]|uniref:hypothetical protein n=1 Tax=Huintestinicola butyrica TaxID=2981728 RepID=UPI0021CEE059|nr:hypothetical protein [Huintestinicola butyrica]